MGPDGIFQPANPAQYLERQEDLGTPKLRAVVASLTSEQRENAFCFLECSTEELAGLPDGQGIQAMVNVRTLLDYLPIIELNAGGSLFSRTAHRSEGKVASNMLPKFEKKSGLVKDRFKSIEEFKMKSIGMTEPKQMATFIALGGIATAS